MRYSGPASTRFDSPAGQRYFVLEANARRINDRIGKSDAIPCRLALERNTLAPSSRCTLRVFQGCR